MFATKDLYDKLCKDLSLSKANNGDSVAGGVFLFRSHKEVTIREVAHVIRKYFKVRRLSVEMLERSPGWLFFRDEVTCVLVGGCSFFQPQDNKLLLLGFSPDTDELASSSEEQEERY